MQAHFIVYCCRSERPFYSLERFLERSTQHWITIYAFTACDCLSNWNIQRSTLQWNTIRIFIYWCHSCKDKTKKSQGSCHRPLHPCDLTLTRSVSRWRLHLKDSSDQIMCIMSSQGCLSFRRKNVFIVDIIEYWALSLLPFADRTRWWTVTVSIYKGMIKDVATHEVICGQGRKSCRVRYQNERGKGSHTVQHITYRHQLTVS